MLSLVIPVYRNEASLPEVLDALRGLHQALKGGLEVVFVVDGSPDRCHELLRERLPATGLTATLVLLTRNFGSFSAVRMGLAEGRGDSFAVMAADLQEPPALVLRMQDILARDGADVVVAQGMEAGGHRGCFDASQAEAQQVGLFALLPAVADTVRLPVVE